MLQTLICLYTASQPTVRTLFQNSTKGWTGAASSPVIKDPLVLVLYPPSEVEPPLQVTEGMTSHVIGLDAWHFLPTKPSSWVVLSQIHEHLTAVQ